MAKNVSNVNRSTRLRESVIRKSADMAVWVASISCVRSCVVSAPGHNPQHPCQNVPGPFAARSCADHHTSRTRAAGALFRINIQRRAAATPPPARRSVIRRVAGRFAAAFVAAGLCVAGPTGTAGAAELLTAELRPSPNGTMAAYRELDAWVRAWSVPTEERKIDPPLTTGACVTLRLSGAVVGRATSMHEDGLDVWRAAREAVASAERALPVDRDALRAQRIADFAQMLTIDLQLAGPLAPLLGETHAAATAGVSPGIEGVAARVGERTRAVFPGTMLSMDFLPAQALMAASGELQLPPVELGELRSKHGAAVYRFESRQLVQPRAGHEPIFLFRGGRVVALNEVSGQGLRGFASRLADHLRSHEWPRENEPYGMTGDYVLTRDQYEPLLAPAREQAVAAFALAFYAATPGMEEKSVHFARRTASRILDRLTVVGEMEEDPLVDPASAAAWIIARTELARLEGAPGGALEGGFALTALARMLESFDENGGWTADLPAGARAMVAHALACAASAPDAPSELRPRAEAATRSLLLQTDRSVLVSLMPWIGYAEYELAAGGAPIASEVTLREMRSVVWEYQVSDRDAGVDSADLAGGIVFTRSRNPLPTWTALRPLAFIARMLGDPRLTDADEFASELASLRRSLRFVMQLEASDAAMHMYRDEKRARGGVRPALWAQTASLDATSLSLLTVCETLRAVERRSGGASDARTDEGTRD